MSPDWFGDDAMELVDLPDNDDEGQCPYCGSWSPVEECRAPESEPCRMVP